MSNKELSKYEIITQCLNKKLNSTEASKILRVSTRHIRRLKKKVRERGAKGLIHGNRGRKSNHRIDEVMVKKTKQYLHKYYADFKPTFACEKLDGEHGIKMSSEKVRQIMIAEKLWKPKPRKTNKEYRSWRPRKEHFGEMIQFDGSYEHWLEDRGGTGEICLLATIDDATGIITKAQFVSDEGVKPVFTFWQGYVKKHGKPAHIYLDKYSTYKQNQKSVLDDPKHLTQFERAMKDLDIHVIHAHSPQAKGRIERLFGTLQDRLVKELRLKKISTIEEANIFLEKEYIQKFNEKFSVPAYRQGNLHRGLTKVDTQNIERIFSIHETRKVNNDFTISYQGRWFQLEESQPTLVCRKDRVRVEERINGDIFISLREKYLNFRELPKRPEKIIKMKIPALTKTKPTWKPPLDHPWRKQILLEKLRAEQSKILTR